MNKSRITVVENVYHQPFGEQPTCVENRFGKWVEREELPVRRVLQISEEWQPLDPGWLKAVAMLVVSNEEGTYRQRIPSAEELAVTAGKVVEIGVVVEGEGDQADACNQFAVVLPGESARFQPFNVKLLSLRCRSGTARVVVTFFPG